jgi:outer membrane protein W
MIKNGLAVLTLALIAHLAYADDYLSPTEERVRLSLGVMYLSSTTDIQLDSSAGLAGSPVNAESVLGLDSSDFEAKFQAMVRVGERNRLRFDYFTLDRTGQKTLTSADAPIVLRDVVLQVGDPVQTDLSMRTLGITYEYSFIHNEKFELAATLGINDTDISSRARVSTATRHVDQSEDQAGPLPTIGFDTTYVISKRFYVDARAQYFKLNVDDISGSLGFYEFDALYRLRPNVSFALGYTAVKADVTSRQTKNAGYFDFDSKGPEFFVRVAF